MSDVLALVVLIIFTVIFWTGDPPLANKLTAIVDYHYEQVIKGKQHGNDETQESKTGSTDSRREDYGAFLRQ